MNRLIAMGATGTWDYVTNSVFDADNPEHRRKFYDVHGIDGKPVGIIGRTHHTKPFDESSKEAFRKTIDEGHTPAIGTWTDSERQDSKPYNDVSMIVSDDEGNLLRPKKKHNQMTILVIDKNANKRFI